MKTSLVSAAASSTLVKADHPQQLKSVTVYWRGRKMVLMQRPQRRLSVLLCRMLRRSWQVLFGAMTVAALTTGAARAGITDVTLPTGGVVQSGTAAIGTAVNNQLTINQSTNKAIIDWQSFSIGKSASVNFVLPDANASTLNRVVGNDPSLIMGSLTSNGKLFLINQAGILVGKDAKVNVASFVASTLNISNDDFLANRLNFAADAGKTPGNVKNKGEITVKDGGSVYLIGANVENDGIIKAPNGEILLAAGRVVKLIDVNLPGVSIDVGGIKGKVTNLGQIMASAGTIGISAGLIKNSGTISASSVEKQGGRIFLRASDTLTTTATSDINANGTTGGNVVLYSDAGADIDGSVSALGSAGNGGYVDTSGKQSLSVKYVPKIGAGGEWYIDPYNVEIVADTTGESGTMGSSAIVATGNASTIHASTITAQLNAGTSVSVSTGISGTENGDITVSAAIDKTAGATATLTLTAAHDIILNNNISSSGGSDGLTVAMTAGHDISQTSASTITANTVGMTATGDINLNGGYIYATDATLSAGANIKQTAGEVHATNSLTMTAAGSILQTAGAIFTANLNATANTGITLANAANQIQSFTGLNQISGDITVANTGSMVVNDTTNAGGDITISTSGHMTVGELRAHSFNLTTTGNADSAIDLNGQLYSDYEDGTLTVNSAGALSQNYVDGLEGPGIYVGGAVNMTSVGDMTINAGISGGNISLTGGSISSGYNAGIYGNAITMNSTGYINLSSDVNGDSIYIAGSSINYSGGLWASGDNGSSGAVTLVSGGNISHSEAGYVVGVTLTATANSGDINLGNDNEVSYVSASALGDINFGNTGDLETRGVTSSNGAVSISTAGKLTVGTGGISGKDQVSLTTTPGQYFQTEVVVGGGGDNPAPPSDILINAHVTALGGPVVLNSDAGVIQSASADAGITAHEVEASTNTGIALNSTGNAIGAFYAQNVTTHENRAATGNIALTNNTLLLTLDGDVTNTAVGGNVAISNSGSIVATAVHDMYTGYINGIDASGNVTLSSTTGDVTLGRVSATNLNVSASGSIQQDQSTGGIGKLAISNTMTASAGTGITLTNTDTCGTNRIANFSATNSGSGNIALINFDGDGVTNKLVTLSNAGGNISVENTGGLETVGLISAAGTVAIATHSPLTIGGSGISAGNGVALVAGSSGNAADALTLNAAIQTAAGALSFGGFSIAANAAIVGPNAPVFNSVLAVVRGPGFTYSTAPIATPPTDLKTVPPAAIAPVLNNLITSLQPINLPLPLAPVSTTQTTSPTSQTIGGGTGEFGDTSASSDGSPTKSAPAKTMFCS